MKTISQADFNTKIEHIANDKHRTASLIKYSENRVATNIASQLVQIGKLVRTSCNKVKAEGNKPQKTRRLVFQVLPDFDEELLPFDELFLVLEENKVRYVRLSEQELEEVDKRFQDSAFLDGSKIILDIHDQSLFDEVIEAKSVYVAVDNDVYQKLFATQQALIDMDVFFLEEQLGTVVDVFDNGAHLVVVVETLDEKEVLLPDVEEYVVSKDFENNKITFTNIQDFLEL